MTTPGTQGTRDRAGPGRAARPAGPAVIPGFGALPAAGLEQAEQACLALIGLHGRYRCLAPDLPAPLYQCLRDIHDTMDTPAQARSQAGRRRRTRSSQRAGTGGAGREPAPVTATPAQEPPGCVPPPGYLAVSALDEITGQDLAARRATLLRALAAAAPGQVPGALPAALALAAVITEQDTRALLYARTASRDYTCPCGCQCTGLAAPGHHPGASAPGGPARYQITHAGLPDGTKAGQAEEPRDPGGGETA